MSKNSISIVVVSSTLFLPFLLGFYLDKNIDPLIHLPLHATLEASGAIMALTMSLFIFSLYKVYLSFGHFNWTAVALSGMGVFDFVHAFMYPGELFVWFHSLAVLTGGVLFSLVWIKERKVSLGTYNFIPLLTILLSLLIVFLTFFFIEQLPAMTNNGEFTTFSIVLNIIGGIGFIAAGLNFMIRYYRDDEIDDLLFAGHTFLFGTSGLLFATSYIWAPSWWLWHFLRFFAYSIALYYTYVLFSRKSDLLHHEKETLALEVAKNNQELIEQAHRLEALNRDLKNRVAIEVEKNLEQDKMIQRQSRLAQMGEMINMIAHQWRQPLNALGLSIQKIKLLDDREMLTSEKIKTIVEGDMQLIQDMSKTINDFMHIVKNDNEKRLFVFQDVVDKVESIMMEQLKSKNISLLSKVDNSLQIDSYQNEFFHVLTNLVSNATDAYDGKKIDDRTISITALIDNEVFECIVKDNAGGIPNTIIDKVFNPYFTTKEQGKGTGLGLDMSKRIVERILSGTIHVHNDDEGAVFTIKIPLK